MKFHFPLPLALLVLLVVAGVAAAILQRNQPSMPASTYDHATVHIGDATVLVEVANTPALREKGLSGHAPLGAGEGMLFVFGQDVTDGFWMKDMLFPIDIIWIDAEGRVVTVVPDATPESYPEVFYPTKPARYVLEVPAGFAQMHGIAEGTKVVVE